MIPRAHVASAVAGLIAPFILVETLGLVTIHVWFPLSKYLWTAHGIVTAKLPIDTAAVLDGLIAVLVGFGMTFTIARLFRGKPLHLWLVFTVFFAISTATPTLIDRERERLLWFLSLPFIPVFLVFAALGFWLASRRHASEHVT